MSNPSLERFLEAVGEVTGHQPRNSGKGWSSSLPSP